MKIVSYLLLSASCLVLTVTQLAKAAEQAGSSTDEAKNIETLKAEAEKGDVTTQFELGLMYESGRGVTSDEAEAMKWYRMAAEQGYVAAQTRLGQMYESSRGVTKDEVEAVKWYSKAAYQGYSYAQYNLARMYVQGRGVTKDDVEAANWYLKVAEQGEANGQYLLALMYADGVGVPKDDTVAYKWLLLAAAKGFEYMKSDLTRIEKTLTPDQRAEGQRMAREFKPTKGLSSEKQDSSQDIKKSRLEATGSGFFITDDGYFITNQHVAGRGATVRVVTASGIIPAKVIKVDELNDLSLLKAEGKYDSLPIVLSRKVQLGATVATVGFPNIGLQGFSPKLAKGEIASLAGIQDDARQFQISVPVQPGNSGGALVDDRGNVIGVVVAKLSQKAALATSGSLAENVNYAIKSSYLLSFLESVPEVAAKLKEPNTTERNFEATIKDVEQAAVLVLVY
jgi:TPR repeat protein